MTASTDVADAGVRILVVKGSRCGADNFIRKPYKEKYLLARINYALTNRTLREKEKVQIGVHILLGGERH